MTSFAPIQAPENLHACVTRTVALRVLEADRSSERVAFPNEAELCQQLGVSRSILREAIKVLVDKGLVEVRPRSGMRSRPREEWNLLDPDILAWQAQLQPDPRFLLDICEVRLAIEPTASGFAAVRATPEDLNAIQQCLERREAAGKTGDREQAIETDLEFHSAVVKASHNPLFRQLSASIREPFRVALSYTLRLRASAALDLAAYRALEDAIRRHHPLKARAASERIVGYAMVAVEQVTRPRGSQK